MAVAQPWLCLCSSNSTDTQMSLIICDFFELALIQGQSACSTPLPHPVCSGEQIDEGSRGGHHTEIAESIHRLLISSNHEEIATAKSTTRRPETFRNVIVPCTI